MGTTVYTESICDRCGEMARREGADGHCPHVGWSSFTLSERGDGAGWTKSRRIEKTLCPSCANVVRSVAQAGDH